MSGSYRITCLFAAAFIVVVLSSSINELNALGSDGIYSPGSWEANEKPVNDLDAKSYLAFTNNEKAVVARSSYQGIHSFEQAIFSDTKRSGAIFGGNGAAVERVPNNFSYGAVRGSTQTTATKRLNQTDLPRHRANETTSNRSISTSSSATTEASFEDILVVYGAVQGGDGTNLNVLGQNFDISALDTGSLPLDQSMGRTAYVEARQIGGSLTATRVEIFDDYSTPGASPVLVYGNVSETDPSIGRLNVADLQIDTTTIGSDIGLQSGSTVSMPGTQPVPGGLILGAQDLVADENLLLALSSSEIVSLEGNTVAGIAGSSTRGIAGSSTRGIAGSSTRGIAGSSTRGIAGSSTRGIAGSSRRRR